MSYSTQDHDIALYGDIIAASTRPWAKALSSRLVMDPLTRRPFEPYIVRVRVVPHTLIDTHRGSQRAGLF